MPRPNKSRALVTTPVPDYSHPRIFAPSQLPASENGTSRTRKESVGSPSALWRSHCTADKVFTYDVRPFFAQEQSHET